MFNLRNFNCIFCIAIICFTFTSCREIEVDKSNLRSWDLRPTNEDNTSNKKNLKEMWGELIMSLKKLRQSIKQFRDEY